METQNKTVTQVLTKGMYDEKDNGTLAMKTYGEVKVKVPVVPTLELSSQFHTPVALTFLKSLRYIFKYFWWASIAGRVY